MSEVSKRESRRLHSREIYLKHKSWRALFIEQGELWDVINDTPLIKLDEPFQSGFVRYYQLIAKAKERTDYPLLNQALGYVRNVQYCRRGDFLVKKAKQKGLRPRGHGMTELNLRNFLMFDIPEVLLKYFVFHTGKPVESHTEIRKLYREGGRHHLWFRYESLCERIVKPHMITHQKAVLPDVESRLVEIGEIADQNQLYKRFWYNSSNKWNKYCKIEYQKRVKDDDRRRIQESLQEFYENSKTTKGADCSAPFGIYRFIFRLIQPEFALFIRTYPA